jgi:predicted transposase YdaD
MMNVLDEIELKGERRGERRGRREGERRGRREGRATMLLRQMEARFGEVPADLAARIEAADEASLDQWAVRVLTATTPEEVLDGDAQPKRSARKRAAPRKRPARV